MPQAPDNLSSPIAYANEFHKVNYSSVSWGAIIAGSIMSIAYEILLNFLGIGLGLSGFNLDDATMFQLGSMTTLWLTISGVISMGLGGWFTGKLCNISCKFKRAYHGLLSWGLATLFTVILTTSGAGAILGNTIKITENSIAAISSGARLGKSSNSSNYYFQLPQSLPTSPAADKLSKQQIQDLNESLSKASLILFLAFLLSAIAGAMGAIYGGNNKHENQP
jgi:hypothetical protein